jgi:hypothetical protein
MNPPKWTPPPIVEATQRLHKLSLRLARIRLAQQTQRNVAMMQALAPEKK